MGVKILSTVDLFHKPLQSYKRGLFFLLTLFSHFSAHAYTVTQFQSVTTPEEAQVNQLRDKEIDQLKLILSRRFTENKEPDIFLRLAELYFEKYRFYFLKENEVYQKQLREGIKPISVNHTMSREALKMASRTCLEILKSKVTFSKMDEVYYFLGYNAEEIGNTKEAEKYYTLVIQNYPQSHYAPEVYRTFAEQAFETQKYEQAVIYYEKATKYQHLPSYPRILYKLSWSYFKTRHEEKALQTLKKVITLTSSDDQFVGLKEEALNDLAFFFVEAGHSYQEAHDYFSTIKTGSDIYTQALSKFSKMYEKTGKYKQALAVNDDLLKEYKEQKPNLIYEVLVQNVELNQKMGDEEREDLALKKLVEYYSRHSSEIVQGEDAQIIRSRTQNLLRDRAIKIHKEAKKRELKSPRLYSKAADLYDLYIQTFLKFPTTEKQKQELSEIRVYHSDALLLANREEEALSELEQILFEEGQVEKRKEAGAVFLHLLINHLNKAMVARISTEDLEKRFLKATDTFKTLFPQDPLVIELEYKKVKLFSQKSGSEGLSKDVRKVLLTLIQNYPTRSESREMAHDLVTDDIKKKEGAQAIKEAQSFLNNKALMNADTKGDLKRFLVTTYLWGSHFELAAQGYAAFATNSQFSESERRSFSHTAFWLYWGIGDLSSATMVAKRCLKSLCKNYDDYCHTMLFELTQVLEQTGHVEKTIQYLKNYLSRAYSTHHRAEASFMIARLYEGLHEKGRAQIFYEKAAHTIPLWSNRERNFAAHAAFFLVEPDFLKFKNITLSLPQKKLKEKTRQKINILEGLVKRYQTVIKYEDGEWGLAALERLVSAFYAFSQELVTAPVPSGLDSQALSQYQKEIHAIAQPMAQKSLGYLREGIQRGVQLGITTTTFTDLTQKLSTLNPKQYPPVFYAASLRLLGRTYEGDFEKLRQPDIHFRKTISEVLLQNPLLSEPWVELGNIEVASQRFKLAQLMYEQALSLNSKNLHAHNNLSVVYFLEGYSMKATQGLLKAVEMERFNKEVKLNLAKLMLGFHHFSKAFEEFKSLANQFPKDQEIQEGLATAELGLGQFQQAGIDTGGH